jgi:HAD superfamily hydrolase (TIGR01450 family)
MRPVPSTLRGSSRPLVQIHDVALLDLDGVVYIGSQAVPGVPDVLRRAREQGMRLAFVTNNAARPPDAVAAHLTELGVQAEADEIVTSAQAAARYLSEHLPHSARVLVVGTTGLEVALRERGLVPVPDATGHVDAVVQGYSPDLNWRLLAEGAIAINRGVPWVATNVDPTVPSPRGPLPGNGSLVAALQRATRADPVVTGKPDPTMHRESLLRSGATHPVVVGDRLDTDIEGANAVGCPSLLVLSGVTGAAELLAAPPRLRPTYLGEDVRALLNVHPQPGKVEGAVVCGRWRVRRDKDRLRLAHEDDAAAGGDAADAADGQGAAKDGQGTAADDRLDALRALCAAAWADDGEPTARVEGEGDAGTEMVSRLGLAG